MTVEPKTEHEKTEHEWTIHSLNIHGLFFQRWCEHVVAHTRGWRLRYTEYPVGFPSPYFPGQQTNESALDLRADHSAQGDLLSILVECKKNNPDFVNWIFFPPERDAHPSPSALVVHRVVNVANGSADGGWTVQSEVFVPRISNFPFATEAREVRGSYQDYKKGDKTKTSNAAISDACQQIALATQAIVDEETHLSRALGTANPPASMPFRKLHIIPAIVTTAHLFTCEFDPAGVDPKMGEIAQDAAKLEEVKRVVLRYALPPRLQKAPKDLAERLEWRRRGAELLAYMPILVVQAESLPALLGDFASQMDGGAAGWLYAGPSEAGVRLASPTT